MNFHESSIGTSTRLDGGGGGGPASVPLLEPLEPLDEPPLEPLVLPLDVAPLDEAPLDDDPLALPADPLLELVPEPLLELLLDPVPPLSTPHAANPQHVRIRRQAVRVLGFIIDSRANSGRVLVHAK
jgi:hypothetical protein